MSIVVFFLVAGISAILVVTMAGIYEDTALTIANASPAIGDITNSVGVLGVVIIGSFILAVLTAVAMLTRGRN